MKKIAVIGAYKKHYDTFLNTIHFYSRDKFIFINSIDKCYGINFLDYIILFDIERLPNNDNIIEIVKQRVI